MGKMNALDAAMLTAIAEAGACLKQDGSLRAAKRLLNQTVARDACEGPTAETTEQKALLGSANQVEAARANVNERSERIQGPLPRSRITTEQVPYRYGCAPSRVPFRCAISSSARGSASGGSINQMHISGQIDRDFP
ncbi:MULTISPECIES: hypothetical protein [unclassified Bradyrhizobium]|uniref:hypothetical protein n=1 Tax=unclassified Bradyrhizobium TaxID=2631580 RepID=UPI001BA817E5|nr:MULTISPECIES: hypothetical protein [unclassified Bradyrhizobium]MBR1223485.1 hypothetical protein [Bradyrhizobium sp. AUGA SZCCT0176]MBR1298915.1 hypothetical protein [Bradyrhizobium sp. AUGA SZCCT0042]